MHVCICVSMYERTFLYVFMYVCMYVCMYKYIYYEMRAGMYVYIETCV